MNDNHVVQARLPYGPLCCPLLLCARAVCPLREPAPRSVRALSALCPRCVPALVRLRPACDALSVLNVSMSVRYVRSECPLWMPVLCARQVYSDAYDGGLSDCGVIVDTHVRCIPREFRLVHLTSFNLIYIVIVHLYY